MTLHAIRITQHACCDQPRPWLNCGDWAEIDTPIVYGLCQSCGSIVACCTCGCGAEATLTIGAVQDLARRWPEQFAQMTEAKRKIVIAATTVHVPVAKLVMFRLARPMTAHLQPRVESGAPKPAKDGTHLPGRHFGSPLSALFPDTLRQLLRLLRRLTTLTMLRAEVRRPRTTDARGRRAGRAA